MLTIKWTRSGAKYRGGQVDYCKAVLNLDIDGYKSIELKKQ